MGCVENRSTSRTRWTGTRGAHRASPIRGILHTTILGFALFFLSACALGARSAYAYPITFSFKTASGQGVPSIKIRGPHGINALTILTSDANGNWTFDTNSLSALDGVIVFSGVNVGMQLSPAEVKVADLVARSIRTQTIVATPSTRPSTIVSWSFYSSGTTPLRNQPVSLLNPQALSCEQRFTDENGYVAWSVLRPASKCDGMSDETGWLQIVPQEGAGMRCSTFSTYRSIGMRSCPLTGDDEAGVSAATCTAVTNPAPSLNSRIQISIQAAGTTQGIQGVELIGNSNFMSLPARFTDSMGNFTFSIGSVVGALPSTAFEIVPVANGYEFIPRRRDSRECVLSGSNTYTCKFSAIRTFSPQGALILDVAQASQPLSGVSIVQPAAGLGCLNSDVRLSDWKGRIVVPVRTRSSCSTSPDTPASRTPISVYPALTGKRFTSVSDFQYCPSSLVTTASIQAYDENSGVQNYSVSGRVVALDGNGFAGVPILLNGQEAARSNADGRFEIFPIAQGASAKVEARLSPYAFDPEFETFSNMGRNIETTIVARAPDPLGGDIDPPESTCPVKTDYALRGRVLDRSGNPIIGARIHNNNQDDPSATTDANGRFSVLVPFGSNNWVTVEHEGALFSPAGRSLVETVCDDESLDFQQVDFESAKISGRTLVSDTTPLSSVLLKVSVNGLPIGYGIQSAHDGSFLFTAPLGSEVQIVPELSQYTFAPSQIAPLSVAADVSDLLFVATSIPVTSPSPFPIVAPTVASPVPTLAPPAWTSAPVAPPWQPAPPSQPIPTAPPLPADPGAPPATALPVVTAPAGSTPPTAPPPQATSVAPTPVTPWPPPSFTQIPQPTLPPSSTWAPPIAPVVPVPSIQPPSTWPPIALPTGIPQATATSVYIDPAPPVSTATPAPMISVVARCGSSAKQYDWVIANLGSVPIDNARWRAFDASQPSVSLDGAPFSLAAGQLVELFDTPRLDISPRFYRLMVYVTDSLGREISLAVEPWDLNRCMQGIPIPEATATPSEPGVPPAPPVQSTATPTPVAPQNPAPPPPGVVPAPPGSTPVPPTYPPGVPALPIETSVPRPPETPAPTQTPTATATPTPSFEINVETRHWRNGRKMTEELFQQLAQRGVLVIRGRAGTQFEQRIPLWGFAQPQYDYTTYVPAGSYRIGFEGGVRVVSVFRRNTSSFTCTVGGAQGARNRCRGIPFALQPQVSERKAGLRGGEK